MSEALGSCAWWWGCAVALLLAGCQQRMAEQPKYEALENAPLFENRQAARHPPAGTVARDDPLDDPRGRARPQRLTLADWRRGAQRYAIFCEPCHGVLGDGNGLVVRRGFPPPPSFHSERLRQVTPEHIVDIISHGFGAMFPYAGRVAPADRWRIALHIQALQRSQQVSLAAHPNFRDRLPPSREKKRGEPRAGGAR